MDCSEQTSCRGTRRERWSRRLRPSLCRGRGATGAGTEARPERGTNGVCAPAPSPFLNFPPDSNSKRGWPRGRDHDGVGDGEVDRGSTLEERLSLTVIALFLRRLQGTSFILRQ